MLKVKALIQIPLKKYLYVPRLRRSIRPTLQWTEVLRNFCMTNILPDVKHNNICGVQVHNNIYLL